MSGITQQQVEAALAQYTDPYLGEDLVSAGAIKNISIEADTVNLQVELGFPVEGYRTHLVDIIREHVAKLAGVSHVNVDLQGKVVAHKVQHGVQPMPNIKNIIAIASGKGGVGKSTTSVNLALALAAEGGKVGILDADIYGPSQPRMLGIDQKPDSKDGKTMEPLEAYGIQAMSIGFLIEEETPMIWRGPMATQALEQMLSDTNWRDLDYLIIDLPPGTGDIQLTLSQRVPLSGSIIVTTPQDIALLDARKALKMFEKVNVPVFGVIENMSLHICSKCGHEEHIFGHGGGAQMAEQYDVDFLGALPLDIRIREQADGGKPTVVADPDGRISQIYREIARSLAARLSKTAKDYSGKFPNIVIKNN